MPRERPLRYRYPPVHVLITHVGGPTVLIEVGGWRLLTDPTFDAPGGKYAFGYGTDNHVDYANDERAPLLFISGDQDHLMPPSIQHANAKHYKSERTITEVADFEGPHLLPAAPGWEQVADHALDWAVRHAQPVTA
jgi:pimeloyl-ACP methyl ester carboxylesterase